MIPLIDIEESLWKGDLATIFNFIKNGTPNLPTTFRRNGNRTIIASIQVGKYRILRTEVIEDWPNARADD